MLIHAKLLWDGRGKQTMLTVESLHSRPFITFTVRHALGLGRADKLTHLRCSFSKLTLALSSPNRLFPEWASLTGSAAKVLSSR